jgi:hypothetical protein
MSPVPPESFSSRFRARPTVPTREPNDVPTSAKVRLVRLVDRHRNSNVLPGAYSLGPQLASAIGRESTGPGDINQIRELLQSLEWWEFYDISEELVRLSRAPQTIAAELEALFVQESLPYRIDEDGIHFRQSQPAEDATAEVRRTLVDDPRFGGPAEQWQKAEKHLSTRPPDAQNAIKDAIGALEGVVKIIAGNHSETLGRLLPSLCTTLGVPNTLRAALSSLYGYRGDEGGIAHGAVSGLPERVHEAELVVHWCAAAIVYLIKKAPMPT